LIFEIWKHDKEHFTSAEALSIPNRLFPKSNDFGDEQTLSSNRIAYQLYRRERKQNAANEPAGVNNCRGRDPSQFPASAAGS
jgi:hypothetical protein